MIILKNDKFLWVDILGWRATIEEPGVESMEKIKSLLEMGWKAWGGEPGMKDMGWIAWDGELIK